MRTRVASSDWWASRKVVSVTATVFGARRRRANLGTDLEEQLAGLRGADGEVDTPFTTGQLRRRARAGPGLAAAG